jgi:hypothetical protein
MAVLGSVVKTSLGISYKTGIAPDGSDIIKTKKFQNVKVNASPENLFAIGNAIGGLLKDEFVEVLRSDESVIFNQ